MLLATPLRLADDMPGDAALIDAVAKGDRRVAVALYDRLRDTMSRALRRVAPRSLEHDDLLQQAFVELVVSLRTRPTVRSLDAWAATIAARVVFHRLRRVNLEARFAAVDDDGELLDSMPDSTDSAHATVSQRQLLERVGQHCKRLNAGRIQVFLLHDVHGYELKEIAEILGITVSNAQTRLVRGRKELHQAIAADAELSSWMKGGV